MNISPLAPRFPIGSYRAAVATLGDGWIHLVGQGQTFNAYRADEIEDFYTVLWCEDTIREDGRADSIEVRAFVGCDPEDDEESEDALGVEFFA